MILNFNEINKGKRQSEVKIDVHLNEVFNEGKKQDLNAIHVKCLRLNLFLKVSCKDFHSHT